MRTIQIAEETYKFLQSKAIPFEEQPDDTIRRLLGLSGAEGDNQSNAYNSNDSKPSEAESITPEKASAGVQSNRQSLRDFYSNVLEGSSSNQTKEDKNSALNNQNSNKSLEKHSNSNYLLEIHSNSDESTGSNSNYLETTRSSSNNKPTTLFTADTPVNQSSIASSDKYSNISNPTGVVKGKKKPKTNLPELVRDGLLKENERVYFQNYRGVKFPQYEVTIADGQLKWNNNRYSMSDLASKILKDLDPNQDNDFVRGPVLWVNAAGKTIAELWDVYLAKKGV